MSNAKRSLPHSRKGRTVRTVVCDITNQLDQAGCDSPAFAAWQLLQRVTGKSRTELLIRMEEPVSEEEDSRLTQLAVRRAQGEPLQYLLGEWEFMGLPFVVGEGVLIPRPETELLCETALQFLKGQSQTTARVLDLCAGSGAVGIAVAAYFPQSEVTAVEKSTDAFCYLTQNAEKNCVPVEAVRGDVLCPPDGFEDGAFDAILSNPPYIPAGDLAHGAGRRGGRPKVLPRHPVAVDAAFKAGRTARRRVRDRAGKGYCRFVSTAWDSGRPDQERFERHRPGCAGNQVTATSFVVLTKIRESQIVLYKMKKEPLTKPCHIDIIDCFVKIRPIF